jgi:hypothetical protein
VAGCTLVRISFSRYGVIGVNPHLRVAVTCHSSILSSTSLTLGQRAFDIDHYIGNVLWQVPFGSGVASHPVQDLEKSTRNIVLPRVAHHCRSDARCFKVAGTTYNFTMLGISTFQLQHEDTRIHSRGAVRVVVFAGGTDVDSDDCKPE